ncbi:MAG TPA: hypothetical protein VIR38_01300 [Thalassobaculum sp.]
MIAGNSAAVRIGEALARDGSGVVEEYAEFIPEGAAADAAARLYAGDMAMQKGTAGDKIMFAFGAEFVEVRVHRRTREIPVPRLVDSLLAH